MSKEVKSTLRQLVHDANNHLSVLYGTLSLVDKDNNMNRLTKQRDVLMTQTKKLINITKEIGTTVKDKL